MKFCRLYKFPIFPPLSFQLFFLFFTFELCSCFPFLFSSLLSSSFSFHSDSLFTPFHYHFYPIHVLSFQSLPFLFFSFYSIPIQSVMIRSSSFDSCSFFSFPFLFSSSSTYFNSFIFFHSFFNYS